MVTRLYHYQFKKREGLILQINDGFGEIAPLPLFSRETFQEALAETLSFLPHPFQAKPKLASVQFGLSSALTPFSLSPLRIPLSALHRPRPNCPTLKLKIGSLSLKKAVDLVKQYVGKHRLRVDCNRSWSLKKAIAFSKAFSLSDFEYLEEPVRTFDDLVQFSSLTRFPIAIDESLRDGSPYQEIPTLVAAIVKPTLMGKIPSLPISTILSSSYETSLGILQIARHASSEIAQGLDTFSEDLLSPPLQVENGFLVWNPSSNPIHFNKLCLIATAS